MGHLRIRRRDRIHRSGVREIPGLLLTPSGGVHQRQNARSQTGGRLRLGRPSATRWRTIRRRGRQSLTRPDRNDKQSGIARSAQRQPHRERHLRRHEDHEVQFVRDQRRRDPTGLVQLVAGDRGFGRGAARLRLLVRSYRAE